MVYFAKMLLINSLMKLGEISISHNFSEIYMGGCIKRISHEVFNIHPLLMYAPSHHSFFVGSDFRYSGIFTSVEFDCFGCGAITIYVVVVTKHRHAVVTFNKILP